MFRNLLISSFDATIRVKRAFHPAPASRGFASHVFLVKSINACQATLSIFLPRLVLSPNSVSNLFFPSILWIFPHKRENKLPHETSFKIWRRVERSKVLGTRQGPSHPRHLRLQSRLMSTYLVHRIKWMRRVQCPAQLFEVRCFDAYAFWKQNKQQKQKTTEP